MTRILITGGTGFIGSNLCKKLLENGHEVIAVDNLITSRKNNIKSLKSHPKFTFFRHDITKPFSLAISHKLSAISQIYHLACPTGVSNLKSMALEMLATCALGTRNILELARKKGARLLFTSSSEAYGDAKVFPQDEEYTGNVETTGFRSPYEEGKRFAESLIVSYVRKYNLHATIVRVFNTYGPGAVGSDTRVVPKFLRLAQRNKPLPVQGNGTQTRTFCYIDDLVNGLIMVLEKGKNGKIYNMGSSIEISIIDLAKLIIKITKSKSKIRFVKRPTHDHTRRLPSLERVKKLGWKPKISLNNGLKRTLLWYGY